MRPSSPPRRFSALLAASPLLAACASRAEGPNGAGEPVPVAPPSAASASTPATSARPAPPPEEEGELRTGRRTFSGMVRPTKDGFDVRGVTIEGSALPDALAKSSIDVLPADPRWFLGAVVRVTAEIVAHEAAPPEPVKGGLVEQTRSGTWRTATRVETAELVTAAAVTEGEVLSSKGLFQVGAYLVRREDLAWSLLGSGGGKPGDRVRLWGQPRTVHCHPDAQCLEGGSIPMFDVARAEKLP